MSWCIDNNHTVAGLQVDWARTRTNMKRLSLHIIVCRDRITCVHVFACSLHDSRLKVKGASKKLSPPLRGSLTSERGRLSFHDIWAPITSISSRLSSVKEAPPPLPVSLRAEHGCNASVPPQGSLGCHLLWRPFTGSAWGSLWSKCRPDH